MASLEALIPDAALLAGNSNLLDVDSAGPGDLLVNIDGYDSAFSRLPFMGWDDWGYKAVVASSSDVIAAGGRPVAIAYSVGATSADVLLAVARGVGDASKDVGAPIYKADTNRSSGSIWIDVAVVGRASRKVRRAGARPGDVVLQLGYVGYGAVAWKVMQGRLRAEDVEPSVVARIRRPRPLTWAADVIARYATSSCDNSDGWAATLLNIAEASGVGIELDDVVVDPAVDGLVDSSEALDSWEDYSIAATVPEQLAEEALRSCAGPCFVVGRVVEGRGLRFRGSQVRPRGWSW